MASSFCTPHPVSVCVLLQPHPYPHPAAPLTFIVPDICVKTGTLCSGLHLLLLISHLELQSLVTHVLSPDLPFCSGCPASRTCGVSDIWGRFGVGRESDLLFKPLLDLVDTVGSKAVAQAGLWSLETKSSPVRPQVLPHTPLSPRGMTLGRIGESRKAFQTPLASHVRRLSYRICNLPPYKALRS